MGSGKYRFKRGDRVITLNLPPAVAAKKAAGGRTGGEYFVGANGTVTHVCHNPSGVIGGHTYTVQPNNCYQITFDEPVKAARRDGWTSGMQHYAEDDIAYPITEDPANEFLNIPLGENHHGSS